MENILRSELEMVRGMITSERQRAYYDYMIDSAKDVICVPLAEVFTPEQIRTIQRIVKPREKQCYRNSHLLATLFPDVLYCEGKVTCFGSLSIDHAWNKVGDKYVDITLELALQQDVTEEQYMVLGEYDEKTINKVAQQTGYYGQIFQALYLSKVNSNKTVNKD